MTCGSGTNENLCGVGGLVLSILGLLMSAGTTAVSFVGDPRTLAADGAGLVAIFGFGLTLSVLGLPLSVAGLFAAPRSAAIAGMILALVGCIPAVGLLAARSQDTPPRVAAPPTPRKPSPYREELRDWTSAGKIFRGRLKNWTAKTVTLELQDGSAMTVDLNKLSAVDQAWLVNRTNAGR